ncbi:MAG: peptidase M4 [Methanosarcinales archaeon]|nr:peptidase M4 [Methanosarcinales archaeon]
MNKNIPIAIGIVAVFLLAVIAFRPMYSPASNYGSNWQGSGYGPGMMGPQLGQGMMGNRMGNMMAVYSPQDKPTSPEVAMQSLKDYSARYGSAVEVDDFMAFTSNYYAQMVDPDSGEGLAEVLVDRYSGLVYPEPGPNVMWNSRYGSWQSEGDIRYDQTAASGLAGQFLAGFLPGSTVMEGQAFPGYYTFDFGRQEIEGMLSVNAYTGEVWVHNWHGSYLGGQEMV